MDTLAPIRASAPVTEIWHLIGGVWLLDARLPAGDASRALRRYAVPAVTAQHGVVLASTGTVTAKMLASAKAAVKAAPREADEADDETTPPRPARRGPAQTARADAETKPTPTPDDEADLARAHASNDPQAAQTAPAGPPHAPVGDERPRCAALGCTQTVTRSEKGYVTLPHNAPFCLAHRRNMHSIAKGLGVPLDAVAASMRAHASSQEVRDALRAEGLAPPVRQIKVKATERIAEAAVKAGLEADVTEHPETRASAPASSPVPSHADSRPTPAPQPTETKMTTTACDAKDCQRPRPGARRDTRPYAAPFCASHRHHIIEIMDRQKIDGFAAAARLRAGEYGVRGQRAPARRVSVAVETRAPATNGNDPVVYVTRALAVITALGGIERAEAIAAAIGGAA